MADSGCLPYGLFNPVYFILIEMKYKNGVILRMTKVIDGIPTDIEQSQEIIYAMNKVDVISRTLFKKEIVVTSIIDGVHSAKSFHYVGKAFDIRTWIYTPSQIKSLMNEIKLTLGDKYDVINENDHIHIEHDPST